MLLRTATTTCADDGSVLVWNVQDGGLVSEYTQHTAAVKTVAWSPDGQWIASGSADKTVRVWQATPTLKKNPGKLGFLAFRGIVP